ncbi:toxin-antitoxin system YwqK family antitoxin [Oceanibaculum nanhaiense]|uniref:toxin-antitoxin system YwqK family antitoxin n=1 Tax=Oceanibaculum nanhaiense TaxID=1909734 RepID=UPI00396E9D4E
MLLDAKGRPEVEGQTLDGRLDGLVRFYAEGRLAMSATYRAGVLDGPMVSYGADGAVLAEMLYRDGEKISEITPPPPQPAPAPPPAEPPGLLQLLKQWLARKLGQGN